MTATSRVITSFSDRAVHDLSRFCCSSKSLASAKPAAHHLQSTLHFGGFLGAQGDGSESKLAYRFPVSVHAALSGALCVALEVDTKQLHYEREEAKAMLCEFLRNQGYGRTQASRLANRAPLFINHLVSTLARRFRSRYLSGRELTTLEIRTVIDPYLESIASQTDDIAQFLECFPDPPGVRPHTATSAPGRFEQRRNTSGEEPRRAARGSTEHLHEGVLDERAQSVLSFFLELGVTQEQVPHIIKRFPGVLDYSVDNKLRPIVRFFLELGILPEDIPKIILRWPQIVGCSLEENLHPKVAQLEAWGVKREAWAKLVPMFPRILTTSQEKQASVVQFLRENLGLKAEDVGKVIMRFPHIMGYSVEGKLIPVVNYLHSIGIPHVGPMIIRCPQLFGLSLEAKIAPVRDFFVSRGLAPEDAAMMMFRFPTVVGLSVETTLAPKWEALLLSGLDPREVVRFPQFFGYSLERRIRPRLRAMAAQGLVDWNLNRALTPSEAVFNVDLERRVREECEAHSHGVDRPEDYDEVHAGAPGGRTQEKCLPMKVMSRSGDEGTARSFQGSGGENGSHATTRSSTMDHEDEDEDDDGRSDARRKEQHSEGLWTVMGPERSMDCAPTSSMRGDEIVGLGMLRLGRENGRERHDSTSFARTEDMEGGGEVRKMVLRRSNGPLLPSSYRRDGVGRHEYYYHMPAFPGGALAASCGGGG